MIHQVILNSERESVEGGVCQIPGFCIDVMRCKNQLLSPTTIVKIEDSSIKVDKLVRPENVEDLRLALPTEEEKPEIVSKNTTSFFIEGRIRTHIPTEIEKPDVRMLDCWEPPHLGVAYELHFHSSLSQGRSETQSVMTILSGCKQGHSYSRLRHRHSTPIRHLAGGQLIGCALSTPSNTKIHIQACSNRSAQLLK